MSYLRVPSYGSSSSASWKYDVFINFHNEDTGKNFTENLYAALDRKGFKVFKGDKEFEREMPISLELDKTIEESRIFIVVFSKSYASSIQCLDELNKILECNKTMGQTVIPIFYYLEPDDPRYQIGVFHEAFDDHDVRFEVDMEKVQMWRKTLKEVSNISGFHLKDSPEEKYIEGVVKEISSKLSGSTSKFMNLKKLVAGVNFCVEKLLMKLETLRELSGYNPQLSYHFYIFFQLFSSTMRIQRVSSSTSAKHDVFLNFRGIDTRNNFTNHLYGHLIREGIKVFKDNLELEIGKPILPELVNAIEESRISIVVFSKNYVSSPWCLDELVKIVECKNTRGQSVIPIFYDVNPSLVITKLEVAIGQHQKVFADHIENVQTWRNALMEITNLFGRELKDSPEAEFIEGVVKEISSKLSGSTSTSKFMNLKKLVAGVNSRLENSLMKVETPRVAWGQSTMISPCLFLKNFLSPAHFLAHVND
ncbi:uncharacterized protein LOC116111828 [Pistacia vera]|uniref:uncharacterized protein LOC116111828 n=1 Tax=Pistacia vera TaxID=55513 RepID=UPI001262BF97|nr:uncharacterized protein LOC116111828 [Pistacia vera]